jgi:hypothetical protein
MLEQTFDPAQPLPPVRKTPRMLAIEAAHGGQDVRHILMGLYNQLGSQAAVARELGVSQPTIGLWLGLLGIRTAAWPEAWLDKPAP